MTSQASHGDIELILFDIDGTLLWPKGAGRTATKLSLLEVFGTEAGIDQHHFGGKSDWQTLLDLLTPMGLSADAVSARLDVFEQAMSRHLGQIIGDYPVEACPGAHDVVARLRAEGRVGLGIVTGNLLPCVPIKLRAAAYDPDWFPYIATGSESPNRNDLPALALARAERGLGRRIRPERVLVVGDTAADIACARALGAVAVAVKTGYTMDPQELIAAGPDYLLDDLRNFFGTVLPA